MYPHERSLVKQLANQPFALIGVNSDSDLDEIREIVKEKNITWRSFWNGPEGTRGPISEDWNVSGWPTIYVLDGEGVIRYKNVRGAAAEVLQVPQHLHADLGMVREPNLRRHGLLEGVHHPARAIAGPRGAEEGEVSFDVELTHDEDEEGP